MSRAFPCLVIPAHETWNRLWVTYSTCCVNCCYWENGAVKRLHVYSTAALCSDRHLCSAFQSTDTKSVLAWKGQLCIFKHLQKYMSDIYSDEKEKVGLETLVFFVVLCVCAWEESIHQLSHTANTRFTKVGQAVPCSHVIVVLERLRETQVGGHWILPATRSQTTRLRTPGWSSKARFPASHHV